MDKLEELAGYIKQLIAVQVLESEDSNWLSHPNKERGERKEELLRICRLIVGELKEERDLLVAPFREEKEVLHEAQCLENSAHECSCGKVGHRNCS